MDNVDLPAHRSLGFARFDAFKRLNDRFEGAHVNAELPVDDREP